jgi:hypothetical protein
VDSGARWCAVGTLGFAFFSQLHRPIWCPVARAAPIDLEGWRLAWRAGVEIAHASVHRRPPHASEWLRYANNRRSSRKVRCAVVSSRRVDVSLASLTDRALLRHSISHAFSVTLACMVVVQLSPSQVQQQLAGSRPNIFST